MQPSTKALWHFSRLLFAGLVIINLLAATQPVSADYTIEQTTVSSPSISFGAEGQSFTTPQAGYINRIKLYTEYPGLTGLLEIREGNNAAGPLLSASIPYTLNSFGWNDVVIDPPVHVDGGASYTFLTYSLNGTLAITLSDEYLGGTMYAVINNGSGYSQIPTWDMAFRISVVDPLTLTVAKSGAGAGKITSAPGGIDCGDGGGATACSAPFARFTQVTLTAVELPGGAFAGWTGPGGFTSPEKQITVALDTLDTSKSYTYTAAFSLIPYTLTIQPLGDVMGSVTSQPAGINCSADASACSAVYLYGTPVTLTVAGGQNATFMDWGGGRCAAVNSGSTCTVTVDQDLTLTPRFIPNVDLAIQESFAFADGLTLTVTVSNRGPADALGALVVASLPQSSTAWTWTCEAAGGASCASGNGSAIHQAVNLPVQGRVTFTAHGVLARESRWSASADVTAPETVFETNPSNNHASAAPYQIMLPLVRH